MPKVVDNYILERKIGSGQFGEVFKGYNRLNNADIAVKVVQRSMLKGKFHELLENEIKVLRTCNNENIIKLYDLKKTANNFYLIIEYCNEGDLTDYLKSKKYLTEDEAVEYLLQILNGFKTLVKAKIMHRDFKLANILRHNGSLKIADFGFSKLLGKDDLASTMLGSPLNMAPEVLNGSEYDSKADIWSIGTVFYELLFGRPPFTAGNMIDLLKNIKSKPLEIPRRTNNISPVCEDVIRRMLTVNPQSRIGWDELFSHKITTYQEEKIKKDLEDTFKEMNLSLSMSRFYIKNNMVINHPSDINKKKELNDFAIDLAKKNNAQNQQKEQKEQVYNGAIINRKTERTEEVEQKVQEQIPPKEEPIPDKQELTDLTNKETEREIQIRTNKYNSNRILHERNIYVFLASVAEDALNNQKIAQAELSGFLLVKKLINLIDYLKSMLQSKKNIFNLQLWDYYQNTKDYHDIYLYISQEFEVFSVYFEQLFGSLKNRISQNADHQILSVMNLDVSQNITTVYKKVLADYCRQLIKDIVANKNRNKDDQKNLWIHVDKILDCLRLEEVFPFEDEQKNQFNFKIYYEEDKKYDLESLVKKIENKLGMLKI